ncbi:hypothetical protein SISNIDRAFT_492152 [Sistotremastrum niveocremeum HHB9708]|uniref:Uncharacterized protein n=1 Tax=Sistotremastrum niveocremeum HHB9708 TaxID=1314777 RepID=A0A165ABT9_9AGAM|nr:hypothetical protein SISNIDRAFT_492152 [Sistotremastrum niveocremeum HHB9708]
MNRFITNPELGSLGYGAEMSDEEWDEWLARLAAALQEPEPEPETRSGPETNIGPQNPPHPADHLENVAHVQHFNEELTLAPILPPGTGPSTHQEQLPPIAPLLQATQPPERSGEPSALSLGVHLEAEHGSNSVGSLNEDLADRDGVWEPSFSSKNAPRLK